MRSHLPLPIHGRGSVLVSSSYVGAGIVVRTPINHAALRVGVLASVIRPLRLQSIDPASTCATTTSFLFSAACSRCCPHRQPTSGPAKVWELLHVFTVVQFVWVAIA
jgi:hypothetical protein